MEPIQSPQENLVDSPQKPLNLEPIKPQKLIPTWRFLLPIAFQLLLILSVPAQAVYTHLNGKTVILQTAPVDPYDFMRGYYQILSYEISNPETLKTLPGWKEVTRGSDYLPSGTKIYVVLESPNTTTNNKRPTAWKPIQVRAEHPKNLSENQIVIQGKSDGWQIKYGLETYYMPENQRETVNADIGETQQSNPEAFVVEAKVNQQGKAVPVSLWVRDRNYRF